MNELANNFYNFIVMTLNGMGTFAPILACFLILIESIIPILPLFVFITINFIYFGHFWGFIISWIFTILGCLLSFFLVRKFTQKIMSKLINKYPKIQKIAKYIESLTLTQLS